MSIANNISAQFGHDGQQFDAGDISISDICGEAADHFWAHGDSVFYVFPDDSMLMVTDAGWDVITSVAGLTSSAAQQATDAGIDPTHSLVDSNNETVALVDGDDLLTLQGDRYRWGR